MEQRGPSEANQCLAVQWQRNQEQGEVFRPGCREAASTLLVGVRALQALTGLYGSADREEGAGMEDDTGQQGLG